MNLGSLVIPVLLAGVAVYGLGKRVDVYAALTQIVIESSRQSVNKFLCASLPRRRA